MLVAASARKHGINDDQIRHALTHPVRAEHLDDGFTMIVGADPAGNLIELGVVDGSDGPVIVHAMPARPQYLR